MFITSVLLQAIGLFLLTVAYGKYANDGVGSVGLKTLGIIHDHPLAVTEMSFRSNTFCFRTNVRGDIGNLLHIDADITRQRLHSDARSASIPIRCQGDCFHVALLRDLHRPFHL